MYYVTLTTHHSFQAKQKLYSDSFIPVTIRQWNILPQSARNAQSLQVFKTKLQTQKHKPTINYNSGARINQILHCLLRFGCSSLNHDLYRKNIINSPLCTCGQLETQAHYLLYTLPKLHCTKKLQKLAMPNNCQQFTIWRRQITSGITVQIVMSLHNYITSTKRFGS